MVDDRGFPLSSVKIEVVGTDVDGMPIDETATTVDFRNALFDRRLPGSARLIPVGDLGVMPGPIPNFPHQEGQNAESVTTGVGGHVTGRYIEPWVTRVDGTFRAAPIPPGHIHVVAQHPGYVDAMSDAIIVRSGLESSFISSFAMAAGSKAVFWTRIETPSVGSACSSRLPPGRSSGSPTPQTTGPSPLLAPQKKFSFHSPVPMRQQML